MISLNLDASFENDVGTSVHLTHIPQDNSVLGAVFILDNVILPLLRNEISVESKLRSSLHLNYAKKFASRVCKFVDCHERGVKLDVPKSLEIFVIEGKEPEHLCCKGKDAGNVETLFDKDELKRLGIQWNEVIIQALENESKETPKSDLPMGEVDFWRRRHIYLSSIVEQLNNPNIKYALDMIEKSPDFPLLFLNIQKNIDTITRLAIEAADNSKFLNTLERHLRTIQDGSLPSMISTLPSLVDGIRMVWSVSQYYCREGRMLPLLKKIASQIVSRITCYLQISEFRQENSFSILKERVEQSKKLLECWKIACTQARDNIENFGKKHRPWEFDAEPLFHQTDYMAAVCNDIAFIIDSLNDVQVFCSPEILSMIDEDDEAINQIVSLVNSLTRKIINCDYDIFDVENEVKWQETINMFPDNIAYIKKHAEMAIENASPKLRNGNFVQNLFKYGHDDILQRYEIELKQARRCYEKYKTSPPLCWRYTKSPGQLAAITDVHRRVKETMVNFKKHGLMMSCSYGKRIRQQYMEFSKDIDSFKSSSYADWALTVCDVCRNVLHSPLLSKVAKAGDTSKIFIEINFPEKVRLLISEGKLFSSLGYIIPESLSRLILLQPVFESYISGLEQLADAYNVLRNKISLLEKVIFMRQIDHLDKIVFQGFSSINWSSQCVLSYINRAKNATGTLQIALTETRKHSSSINKIMVSLANMSLVSKNRGSTSLDKVVDIGEGSPIDDLKHMYSIICSLVKKIDLVCRSSSESEYVLPASSLCETLNKYWAIRLHHSLFEMLLRFTIELFYQFISMRRKLGCPNKEKSYVQKYRTMNFVTSLRVKELNRSLPVSLQNGLNKNNSLLLLATTIIEEYTRFQNYYQSGDK